MMGAPGVPDLSNAEIVDYSVVEGDGRLRLKLKDGSIIEVKITIMNILRAGNEPSTGLPTYVVQSQPVVRLVECPKELRKAPQRAPGDKSGGQIPGFG